MKGWELDEKDIESGSRYVEQILDAANEGRYPQVDCSRIQLGNVLVFLGGGEYPDAIDRWIVECWNHKGKGAGISECRCYWSSVEKDVRKWTYGILFADEEEYVLTGLTNHPGMSSGKRRLAQAQAFFKMLIVTPVVYGSADLLSRLGPCLDAQEKAIQEDIREWLS